MFRKHKYDYAIRAAVIRRKRVDANTMTVKVQVEEVLFCGQVKFPRSNHVTLWINSSCGCPELRPSRHYLLMGHENVSKGRFLLSPSTALAVKWRDKWAARVKMWHQRVVKRGQRLQQGENSLTPSTTPTSRKARKRGKKRKHSGKHKRNRNSKHRSLERKTLLTNRNLTRK